MKFIILNEDSLKDIKSSDDIHLYGNPKDGFYYFDGTKLRKISLKTASKIIRDAEESNREESDESESQREKRLAKIKKDLSNSTKMLDKIKWEKEKIDLKDLGDMTGDKPDIKRDIRKSKLDQLKDDIEDLIASQVGIDLRLGYGKPNPFSVEKDILLKSRRHMHSKKIPLVSVYFDRSGSWGDSAKTNLGWDAISVLKNYEQAGLIDIEVYYFAVHVWRDESKALSEINNSGEPIIQHMIATNSDNIIIMTDDHVVHPDDEYWNGSATYPESVCTVPGAAIGIFYGCSERSAKKTMDHIRGEQATKYYMFSYGE